MRPRVLIGSSKEKQFLADAISENLHEYFDTVVWPHIFAPSGIAIDTLLDAVSAHDYAIFVLSPEDRIVLRGDDLLMPRDNVIFESGLFMGRYGRKRVFLVTPSNVKELHLPSDFKGVTTVLYDESSLDPGENEEIVLNPACIKIRKAIRRGESLSKALTIATDADNLGGNVPLKAWVKITNTSSIDVLISRAFFRESGTLRLHHPAPKRSWSKRLVYPLSFRRHDRQQKHWHVKPDVLVLDGETVDTYIGVDVSHSVDEVKAAQEKRTFGTLYLCCSWMEDTPRFENYDFLI